MDKPVDSWTLVPSAVNWNDLPVPASLACFPLALAARSDRVRIVDVVSGRRNGERLKDIGLAPGVEISVQQNNGCGPLVLRVGETRLALGAELARRVMVVPVMEGGL